MKRTVTGWIFISSGFLWLMFLNGNLGKMNWMAAHNYGAKKINLATTYSGAEANQMVNEVGLIIEQREPGIGIAGCVMLLGAFLVSDLRRGGKPPPLPTAAGGSSSEDAAKPQR